MTSTMDDEKYKDEKYKEASDWVARLHADDRRLEDEEAFRQWLAAAPDNARRFEKVSAMWHDVGGLRDVVIREDVRPALLSRRAVLAGTVTTLFAGGGLFAWSDARAGLYETGIGEQKRVTLEDGTQLFLDTGTRLKVRLGSARRLHLQRGRVHSSIASADGPFLLEAGSCQLMVTRGKFDVQYEKEQVSFLAVEGVGSVINKEQDAAPKRMIRAGDRFLFDNGRAVMDRPDIQDMMAWQSGRAAFRGETLADAVMEMNRYSNQPIILEDGAIASLRISGVFSVGDNARFARTLENLLPVRAQIMASRITLSAL